MLCSEVGHFLPIRNNLILPLPGQNFLVIIGPGGNRPVRIFCAFMVARTAGEGVNDLNPQLLGQLNGIDKSLMILLCQLLLRMQRIAVTA
ncbi:hypothetical protein D3C76_1655800 [compost metagenome]